MSGDEGPKRSEISTDLSGDESPQQEIRITGKVSSDDGSATARDKYYFVGNF